VDSDKFRPAQVVVNRLAPLDEVFDIVLDGNRVAASWLERTSGAPYHVGGAALVVKYFVCHPDSFQDSVRIHEAGNYDDKVKDNGESDESKEGLPSSGWRMGGDCCYGGGRCDGCRDRYYGGDEELTESEHTHLCK